MMIKTGAFKILVGAVLVAHLSLGLVGCMAEPNPNPGLFGSLGFGDSAPSVSSFSVIEQVKKAAPAVTGAHLAKVVDQEKTLKGASVAGFNQLRKAVDTNLLGRSDETTPMCQPRNVLLQPNVTLPLCCLPVDELPSGRPLGGSVVHEKLPTWLNLTLVRQGQAFAIKNRFSVTFSAAFGLIIGLSAPDARNVLAFTGNSDSHKKATRRYVATSAQMYIWFDEVFSPQMDDNLILESIANVRAIHTNVAHRANSAPKPITPPDKYDHIKTDDLMWAAIEKDLNTSPLAKYKNWPANYTKYDENAVAVNQYMQGMTGCGFWGYLIIDPESLFVWDATQDELKSYLHLWAVILYMMGVEDEYNLSLQRTPSEATKFAVEAQNLYLIPGFFHMDKTTKVMMEALAVGLDDQFGKLGLGLRRVMYLVLTTLFKVPATNLRALFSPAQELAQKNWETVFVLSTRVPVTRTQMNNAMKLGFESVRTGMFGPYLTPKQIVEGLYYPNNATSNKMILTG